MIFILQIYVNKILSFSLCPIVNFRFYYKWASLFVLLNAFFPNAPFLYSLRTSENRRAFLCFQGVEKWCIWKKWINKDGFSLKLLLIFISVLYICSTCLIIYVYSCCNIFFVFYVFMFSRFLEPRGNVTLNCSNLGKISHLSWSWHLSLKLLVNNYE